MPAARAILVETTEGGRYIGLEQPARPGDRVEITGARLYGGDGDLLDPAEYPRGYVPVRLRHAVLGNPVGVEEGMHIFHINRAWS